MPPALHVHKASPVPGRKVPGIVVRIEKEMPPVPGNRRTYTTWMVRARAAHMREAKALAKVLIASLPGGTLDALLVELLDRKRNVFRVPGPEVGE